MTIAVPAASSVTPAAPAASSRVAPAGDDGRASRVAAAKAQIKASAKTADTTEAALVKEVAAAKGSADPTEAALVAEAAAKAPPNATEIARQRAEDDFMARSKNIESKRRERLAADAAAQQTKREADAVAQQRAALEADTKRLDLAKTDPISFLRSQGYTAKQLVEAGLKEGSPEAALEARIIAAEQKAESLEKWKADFLRQSDEEKRVRTQRDYQGLVTNEKAAFVAIVDASPEKYAHLSAWRPEHVAEEAFKAGREYWEAYQEQPTREHILKFLDKQEGERKAARKAPAQGAAGSGGATPAPAQARAAAATRPTAAATPQGNPRSSRKDLRSAAIADLRRAKG